MPKSPPAGVPGRTGNAKPEPAAAVGKPPAASAASGKNPPAAPTYLVAPGRRLPAHPAATAFPDMPEHEFKELVADIAANGVRTAVAVTRSGMVLDGRHRCRAAELAGKPVMIRELDVNDAQAAEFVLSLNLKRRHLTPSQRAASAAELATAGPGRPKTGSTDPVSPGALPGSEKTPPDGGVSGGGETPPSGGVTQSDAADKLNVGLRSVQRAEAVRRTSPELHDAVKRGDITVADAAGAVKTINELPPEKRAEATAKVVKKVVERSSAKAAAPAAGGKPKPSGRAAKAARKAAGKPAPSRKPPQADHDTDAALPPLPSAKPAGAPPAAGSAQPPAPGDDPSSTVEIVVSDPDATLIDELAQKWDKSSVELIEMAVRLGIPLLPKALRAGRGAEGAGL